MDEKKYTYLVEPSDRRNIILLGKLKEKYAAEEFSFQNAAKYAFENTVVIFSPARRLTAAEILALPPAAAVFGGNQSPETKDVMAQKGTAYINLLENELYAVRNALLTAEGALALLIGATEKSVFQNSVLVLGCGRVGKAVLLLLQKLGIRASAAAFGQAEFDAHPFYAANASLGRDFEQLLPGHDVIINTVPHKILDAAALNKVRPEAVIIELASVGCLDRDNLGEYSFKYIPAPALPVKYCAEAAAEIMLEAVGHGIRNIEYLKL